MTKVYEGKLKGRGKKIAIVVSRFNEFITKNLLDGCLDELNKLKVSKNDVAIVWVPGAFEIPLVALKLAKKNTIDAVICLGAVIKGETYHYELVAQETATGIGAVARSTEKPIIFEVLATETVDKAYQRSEVNGINKGRDAARAAVEMCDLLLRLKKKEKV